MRHYKIEKDAMAPTDKVWMGIGAAREVTL